MRRAGRERASDQAVAREHDAGRRGRREVPRDATTEHPDVFRVNEPAREPSSDDDVLAGVKNDDARFAPSPGRAATTSASPTPPLRTSRRRCFASPSARPRARARPWSRARSRPPRPSFRARTNRFATRLRPRPRRRTIIRSRRRIARFRVTDVPTAPRTTSRRGRRPRTRSRPRSRTSALTHAHPRGRPGRRPPRRSSSIAARSRPR